MKLDHTPAKAPLRDTRQSSEYLLARHGIRRAPATLNKLRIVGGGPTFRRLGPKQIVYDEPSLDEYAETLIGAPLRSTSEAA